MINRESPSSDFSLRYSAIAVNIKQSIRLSWPPPRFIAHGDERICRGPEPAWPDRRPLVCGENLQLFPGVSPQLGFGTLDARMPEPERYFANVGGHDGSLWYYEALAERFRTLLPVAPVC